MTYLPVSSGLQWVGSATAGSNAQSLVLSSLLGETDDTYFITILGSNAAAGAAYWELRPNSLATNQASQNFRWYGTGSGYINNASNIYIAYPAGAAIVSAHGYVFAKHNSSRPRIWQFWSYTYNGGMIHWVTGGKWEETSTQLTSLQLYTGTVDGIAAGTTIRCWKLNMS